MKRLSTCYLGKWTVIASWIFLLTGCHHRVPSLYITNPPTPLPARAAAAGDPGTMMILNRLTRKGVQVITIGQDYLISIQASLLFAGQSPRILWRSYATLNDVVCYIKQFRTVGVSVTAFSSKYVSPTRERALTSARARAVADYLWSQDIDSRFIFTRGLGSDKPISAITQGGDHSENARIEITFRNAVA